MANTEEKQSLEEKIKILDKTARENQEHEEALELINSNEEWSYIYQELLSNLAEDDATAVTRFRAAGEVMQGIYVRYSPDESRNLVNAISKTKRLKIKTLRCCKKFADEFTLQQVNYLSGLFNESLNYRLNQTHLQYCMVDYIPTTEVRIKYLRQAVEQGLPAIELQKLIAADYHRNTGIGRTHERPTTKDALLLQIQKAVSALLKKDAAVWENPEDPALVILSENLEEVTEVTRSELNRTIAALETSREVIIRLLASMRGLDEQYLDAILNASHASPATDPAFVTHSMSAGQPQSLATGV